MFDYERLDVYRVSISMTTTLYKALGCLPPGHSELVNQTKRAAISVPLNVAEGAGEFSAQEKIRFYRIARRSASECAAALDILRGLGLIPAEHSRSIRDKLDRIAAMLTVLCRQTRE